MGQFVVMGAMLSCSFGAAPATLIPSASSKVMVEGRPAGVITDIAPGSNIPPFAMCSSLANPTVAAATSAALGVLTPMPCIPTVAGPWIPAAPKTMLGKVPALVSGSMCTCAFGGVIQVTNPGSTKSQAS